MRFKKSTACYSSTDRYYNVDNNVCTVLMYDVHKIYCTKQDAHALLIVLGYEVFWVPGLLPLHIQP